MNKLEIIAVLPFHHLQDLFFGKLTLFEDEQQRFTAWDAAQRFIILPRKGNAKLIGQALPASKVIFGGIRENAVEIKNEAFDHAGFEMSTVCDSPRCMNRNERRFQCFGRRGMVDHPCDVMCRPPKPKTTACHVPPAEAPWIPSPAL